SILSDHDYHRPYVAGPFDGTAQARNAGAQARIRSRTVFDSRHRRDARGWDGPDCAGCRCHARLMMNRAAFHLLAKPTGAVCNLDCKYCFFLSKEMLYPGSRFQMADDLLEAYIQQLLESQAGPEVIVGWQGGEPTLMGLDFFERSIKYVERYRKPGQQVSYTIQTNGTKIDEAWAAFFKKHKVLVGLSVDGPRALHDAYRVYKGGKGSFCEVSPGWKVLNRHGVDVNVLCCVHAMNAEHPLEVYR